MEVEIINMSEVWFIFVKRKKKFWMKFLDNIDMIEKLDRRDI